MTISNELFQQQNCWYRKL